MILFLIWIFSFGNLVQAAQSHWNVPVTAQSRVFPNVPQFGGQSYNDSSLAIKPKYENGNFKFEPFYRADEVDTNRTHGDIRELSYTQKFNNIIWTAGISKVFWGVTETQHLVDIVNQTDFVDSPDSNEKLGQPMIHAFWPTDYGNWDIFLLAGFRPRTFPGLAGRFRGDFPVDPSLNERVKTSDIDFAARWSKQIGGLDLGLSAFNGNSRDPIQRPNSFTTPTALIATYDNITQVGLDMQYTMEKLILKAEAINRQGIGSPAVFQVYAGKNPNNFSAATVGFEYSLDAIKGTDVGLLLEYSYDTRQPQPEGNSLPVFAIFQNDFFFGVRWILNDAYESNLFLGASADAETKAGTIALRYNRRIYENLSLNLRTLTLVNVPDPKFDPYASVQNDSFFEINLTQYFLF